MADSIADRVRRIVSEHLGVPIESVTPEARIVDDLQPDSLDVVELVMGVEEGFGIEVPDEAADRVATVGDAIALVERLTGAQETAEAAAEDLPPSPNGVVALMIGDDGHVWATATDFDRSSYGGFELHQAQRIRARAALRREFVSRVCNTGIARALDDYTVDRMVEDLVRDEGHHEAFVLIGHPDAEVSFGDYLNRAATRPSGATTLPSR